MKEKLLNLYKNVWEKQNTLCETLGNEDFLGFILDDLGDLVLDVFEVPQDNSIELSEKYGMAWHEQPGAFTRDYQFGILSDFADGKISFKVTVEKLSE